MTGTVRLVAFRILPAGALVALLALPWFSPQPAAAQGGQQGTVSPLPASDYSVRSVCAVPAPGHARCLALELVPRTAAARAHTHPLGMTRSAPIRAGRAAEGADGLRPQDVHSAYQLPAAVSSAQTIAVVDAYNDPTAESDLRVYDEEFGLPACTAASGCFSKVNQQGQASPLPATEGGWALEISLDIEVAHATCQSCHILLVEAQASSYEDLEAAEDSAVAAGATEISNSWSGGEPGTDSAAFNHPGVVITAAAGDDGYLNWDAPTPGERGFVGYPASSPHVVGVGGTRLELNGPSNTWGSETVWNGDGAGGGGCSERFVAPPWQQGLSDWSSVGCGSKRAVADVSADADPYTGVAVYDSTRYEGQVLHWLPVGGTSLASPLIASVFALAGGAGGVEYPAKTLYGNEVKAPGSLHDVESGSNGECSKPFNSEGLSGCSTLEEAASCSGNAICLAGPGYDGPTGVGTPNGIDAFEMHPNAPAVVTGAASSISQSAATLNATVNPNGREVSDCKFEYGTTASYGSSAPCSPSPGSGSSSVAVSASIAGLSESSTYHFRVVATNSVGTSYGADREFMTYGTPEFGRCVKVAAEKEGKKNVYHGGFRAATCLVTSAANTGKYEWEPGVAKAGFTMTLQEGEAILETLKKSKVTCKAESSAGEIAGTKELVKVVVRLTGCESSGEKCTTLGHAEGELATKKLEGELGWEVKDLKKVALDLYPVGKTGPFLEYSCVGGVPITVTGAVLVPVKADKMLATSTLKYTATKGKQKPEHLEGGRTEVLTASLNGEAFEQIGETATLTQVNEEAVEINAAV
jgi:hypothetical protein